MSSLHLMKGSSAPLMEGTQSQDTEVDVRQLERLMEQRVVHVRTGGRWRYGNGTGCYEHGRGDVLGTRKWDRVLGTWEWDRMLGCGNGTGCCYLGIGQGVGDVGVGQGVGDIEMGHGVLKDRRKYIREGVINSKRVVAHNVPCTRTLTIYHAEWQTCGAGGI